ncbi:unnamed protein product [Rhizophagus irregularis]|nr:unnamed protein product [Rhizophagus irregularis]
MKALIDQFFKEPSSNIRIYAEPDGDGDIQGFSLCIRLRTTTLFVRRMEATYNGKTSVTCEVAFVKFSLRALNRLNTISIPKVQTSCYRSISDTNRAKLTIQIEPYGGPPGIKVLNLET